MAFNFGGAGAFGAPQNNFQTPAFGATPATPATGFAVGGGFGAQPPATFGAPQMMGGAQGFATPAPQFGGGAGGVTFGGGTAFSQPVASIGGFGQPNAPFAPAPAAGFGQPSGTGFGIAAPQGGMGVAGFPAAQGGFGAAQGGFGAAAPAVGFGAQTAFGAAPAATAFGASSFGGAPASTGFGSTGFGAAPQTFIQTSGGFQGQQGNFQKQDKSDGQVNSICASMRDQCLESQRFLDYQQGKKGPAQQPAFGAPVAAASGGMAPFGQQVNSFAQPATTGFAFGQPQTTPASFQLQSQAQQPPFAGFGAAAAPAPSQPMNAFGATPFGQPAGKPAAAANLFGAPPSTGTNAFTFPSAAGTGLAMPSAAAQPFGNFAQAAPGTAPLFGAAPTNAPFGTAAFTSPFGASSAALPAFNSAANLANAAPAAPVPSSAPSSSAPVSEPKYADVFSSKIELEDRDAGRRYDSAVYARHHNVAVSRDQPPTLIWQTPIKSTKVNSSRNTVSSTPRHSGRSMTDTASLRDDSSTKGESKAPKEKDEQLQALDMLHKTILPLWNRTFYSGKSKEEILPNIKALDQPLEDVNYVTKFDLYEKRSNVLTGTLVPRYESRTFTDTQGYMLVAETTAFRHSCDARTCTEVPVKLKMTVSNQSFSALLAIIVRKYGPRQFSDEAIQDDPFYPFDLCFEFATPRDASPPLRHLPKFIDLQYSGDVSQAEDAMGMIYSNLSPGYTFHGFPLADGTRSGPRHVQYGNRNFRDEALPPLVLETDGSQSQGLQIQPHPGESGDISGPKLYFSLGCYKNIINGIDTKMLKTTPMDLEFEAAFSRAKLKAFDNYFIDDADDKKFDKFLEDFHTYFEASMKSPLFGDYADGLIRPVFCLKPMGHQLKALDRFQKLPTGDRIWHFRATHSFD
jgi:hypothetical protein